MLTEFFTGTEWIGYNLIRRKGQKHINIRVHHDGQVTVSAPLHTGADRIRSALETKRKWINRHVGAAREQMDGIGELSAIPVGGCIHTVVIDYDATRRGWVKIDPDTQTIHIRSASVSSSVRKLELKKFLKRYGRKRTTEEVLSYSADARISVERVFFRDQKTRWGSSSTRGNISLNWRIVLLPTPVRRYLILHELAHQVHMNHSGAFWGKVFALCPDYQEQDRWLKEHSYLLGLFR
jgi:predicted metal-dependent hydrolase